MHSAKDDEMGRTRRTGPSPRLKSNHTASMQPAKDDEMGRTGPSPRPR
jgi:hypothetical protein